MGALIGLFVHVQRMRRGLEDDRYLIQINHNIEETQ